MSDPRNVVVSSPFSCEREGGRYHLHGGWAPWPELVAFAEAILAADEQWLDSQTPTLEELRAKYPGAMVEITPLHIPGDDYLARLVTERERASSTLLRPLATPSAPSLRSWRN